MRVWNGCEKRKTEHCKIGFLTNGSRDAVRENTRLPVGLSSFDAFREIFQCSCSINGEVIRKCVRT